MAFERSRDSRWDHRLITGTALLVPFPILGFYLCRRWGLSVGASEDIATLLVMVPLGGPHVAATFLRTMFNPEYRARQRGNQVASWGIYALVAGTAIASVFLGVRVLGLVPMQLLLTGFFFWASFHILQQTAFCVSSIATRQRESDRWGRWLELAVVFGSLYPISFFRMSMIDASSPDIPRVDPNSLATQMVISATGSSAFADEYVFRIGRTVPILPAIVRSPWVWIGALLVYMGIVAAYAARVARQWREGVLESRRFQLVAASGALGFLVPVVPNLDSAFQGMNAWHCAQYLCLSWLLHREATEREEPQTPFARWFKGPHGAARFYFLCLGFTLATLAAMFGIAWGIAAVSGGHWQVFGTPPGELAVDARTGGLEYRPGSLLISYYLLGFGLLLMHYLQDSWFFLRRGSLRTKIREVLVGRPAGAAARLFPR